MAVPWSEVKADCKWDEPEEAAASRMRNGWRTASGGTIANKYGFKGLDDKAAHRVMELLNQGRAALTFRALQSDIDLGRVASELKALLADQFWPVIKKEWFENRKIENRRRKLEVAMQMFEFSKGDGDVLSLDIPKDAYLHVMRAANRIDDQKKRIQFLHKVQRQGACGDFDLTKTKDVRRRLDEMTKEISDNSPEEARLIRTKKFLGFVYAVERSVADLSSRFKSLEKNARWSDLQPIDQKNSERFDVVIFSAESLLKDMKQYAHNDKGKEGDDLEIAAQEDDTW